MNRNNSNNKMALVKEAQPPQGAGPMARSPRGVRRDPAILYYRVCSSDWRKGAKVQAVGLNGPAVDESGEINFCQPKPGQSDLSNFNDSGRAPWDFVAHQIRIVIYYPAQPTARQSGDPLTHEYFVGRGVQFSELLMRGFFSLEADQVPILQQCPVAAIGAGGGIQILGAPQAATAQLGGSSRFDAWPLPDPLYLRSSGPALKAKIRFCQSDFGKLGLEEGDGIGAPLPVETYIDAAGDVVSIPEAYPAVELQFWGRRGLDVYAGASGVGNDAAHDGPTCQ